MKIITTETSSHRLCEWCGQPATEFCAECQTYLDLESLNDPNLRGEIMLIKSTWLTTKEAAHRLGVALITVQKMCQQGRLSAVKIGRDWLIDPHDPMFNNHIIELVLYRIPQEKRL